MSVGSTTSLSFDHLSISFNEAIDASDLDDAKRIFSQIKTNYGSADLKSFRRQIKILEDRSDPIQRVAETYLFKRWH